MISTCDSPAVGTLASGIAHDFNNLLQAISGYSQILLLKKEEKDKDHEKLNAIYQAGERAAQLVQQLLLFSRKVATERKPFDINQEVEQIKKMLERTIPKMIAIEIRLGSRLWSVNADPVQIEQILLNLGSNAADAMPNGGELLIETENVKLDKDYVQTLPGVEIGSYVSISVSDTGEGIDEQTVEHIFDPFFTTKDIGKGTGLGLASVYGIVKNHGGHITCNSEIGKGTSFQIFLPAVELSDSDDAEGIETIPLKGGTENILLVDDEESIRDLSKEVLGKFGYSVFIASSGEEALEIYTGKSKVIDLIILDLGMPGMGGYKCLQEILSIDKSAKIIVASGYSMESQIQGELKPGEVEYLAKPYNLNGLLGKVRDVLDKDDFPLKPKNNHLAL